MTDAEHDELTQARDALMRQRSAIAKRLRGINLTPVSKAQELLAIEAVDHALSDAGRPHLPAGL